jgi:hypothetical protein
MILLKLTDFKLYQIGYDEKYVEESVNTKFLDLQIGNLKNWKNHIDQMVPKLSRACYAVRSIFHISNTDTLKPICFAYFLSRMKYGIIFWGNSSNSNKRELLELWQVLSLEIHVDVLFIRLEIFPLPCEYIFSLMNFVANNQEYFETNSAIHNFNTRNRDHLYRSIANLSCFEKSAYCSGIRIFNSLPSNLRGLKNKKMQFKVALKRLLNTHFFYSVDQFLMLKSDSSF